MPLQLLPMAMRRLSLGRVTVRALAAIILLAILALEVVQRAAAVPFAELSPPPALQFVETPTATFCVLMASGRASVASARQTLRRSPASSAIGRSSARWP